MAADPTMTATVEPAPLDDEAALERSVLTAIAVFRWATLAWTIVVVGIDASNDSFSHLWAAVALVGATTVFTVWASVLARTRPRILLTGRVVAIELALDAMLVLFDPWTYGSEHSQSLGSAWPLAGIMTAAVRFGAGPGMLVGLGLGLTRLAGQLRFDPGRWSGDQKLGAIGTIVLYALAGGVAGFAAERLRDAARRISAARAREQLARELHDGVLQTLAVVQRRSDDAELRALAREQEDDLRRFLFGSGDEPTLPDALRATAARYTRIHGGRADVVSLSSRDPTPAEVEAIVGAVREALNNAGKHGRADHVTVYLDDADEGIFCSVKDDGCGFDRTRATEGVGLSRSIRGRIEEVGGRVEIDSTPDRGTEVRMWVG